MHDFPPRILRQQGRQWPGRNICPDPAVWLIQELLPELQKRLLVPGTAGGLWKK